MSAELATHPRVTRSRLSAVSADTLDRTNIQMGCGGNLKTHGIDLNHCISLEVVAHGPLYEEDDNIDAHRLPRDKTHALERDLCNAMKDAKYEVLK
jgi:hypothetical protein